MAPEPRVTTIEGRAVLVVERKPPIPPTLVLLLEGGRDPSGRVWSPMRVAHRTPLRIGGAAATCATDDHRMSPWLEGFHTGSDGIARHLRLQACSDCGAICVRDISIDTMPGLSSGRHAPRRRDHVIGWYSGARAQSRVYAGVSR